jgi:UDP-N-acetylglucosamine--N-acetylmuramyl-(pentapeptide) pyrophosphoryl-undecaprenol N-acetylglucosamine transferase
MEAKSMRLLIAGGGSGGHLFPGVAVAQEFLSRSAENKILFVGTKKGIEAKVLPKLGYNHAFISISGFQDKSALRKIVTLACIPVAVCQSLWIIYKFKPDTVLGVGGYASFPVLVAGFILRKKRAIQEQNVQPGLTNRLLSKIVHKIFLSFEVSKSFFSENKSLVTGNPVRAFKQPEKVETDKFTILVFGGSQGAHSINRTILETLPFLAPLKDRIHFIHQTGKQDLRWVESAYYENQWKAEIYDFIYDMEPVLTQADFIICRAGATTLSEVSLRGKACLLVPYPHASHHQQMNAEALVKKDAAKMILDWQLNSQSLTKEIKWAYENPRELEDMRKKIVSFSKPYAAKAIVDQLIL